MVFNDYANRRRSQQLTRWAMGENVKVQNPDAPIGPQSFAEALGSFFMAVLMLSLPGYLIGSVLFGGHAEPIYPYGDGRMIQEFVYSDFGGFLGIMTAVVLAYLFCRKDLTKQYR